MTSYGLHLSSETLTQLGEYYRLLTRWNDRLHLVAPCAPEEFATRHVLESLLLLDHLPQHAKIADVGSGAGLPIIPCLVARADLEATLIESSQKKAVFLREAVRELGLKDAEVETSRFEELLPRPELHETLDLVSIRAVRIETRTLLTLQAFLRTGGKLLLFRGSSKSDLEDAPPPPLSWMATYPLVDSLHSKLVVLSKTRV